MRGRRAGGGFAAVRYSLARASEAGLVDLTRRLRTHNACKTCAVGMSGMVNERGSFPEVCKKSVQAQAADMMPPMPTAHVLQALCVRRRRVRSTRPASLARATE